MNKELNLARKGINKQQVLQAIKEIVFSGQLPKICNLRTKLKVGSITTIQKYLYEWKIACFKNAFLPKENFDIYDNHELVEKNHKLEQILSEKITQNEHYVQELINAEKINIVLKEKTRQLQLELQELQLKLSIAEATNNAVEQLTQRLQNQLDLTNNEVINKMQHTIDDLRIELKTVNETSLSALRDTSTQGHEALMQEKLISINLQAKLDGLTKELAEKNKQLELFELKTQVQVRSLQRQIKVQQQALQRFITPEELSELIQGLAPNLLLSDSYGK